MKKIILHTIKLQIISSHNSYFIQRNADVLFVEPVLFDIKSGYIVHCIVIEQLISVRHNTTPDKLIIVIITISV